MQRIFTFIGITAVALIALGVAGVVFLAHRVGKLDQEAAAYATDSVTTITAQWNPAALTARATPQLAASISPTALSGMFGWFGTLGPLQDQPVCGGQSSIFAAANGPTTIAGTYKCAATYKAGPATISITLLKTTGAWHINGFHVNSPALIPPKAQEKI